MRYYKFIFNTLLYFILVFNQSLSDELDQKIRSYILKNPEIIIESLNNYEELQETRQKNENKQRIKKLEDIIFKSQNNLFQGQELSENIIVEFFDYNCSFCKRVHKDIIKVLEKSNDIKIIYKNFPILSENSVKLAKYSIILSEINNSKFSDFHNFIINHKGKLKDSDIDKIFKKLNLVRSSIDNKLDDKEVKRKLQEDINLAKDLGLRGTPAFIIGNEIIFGYIDYNEILSKINQQ